MFRIKKLDIFVAKQFGLLFLGTFFICQFVLMMQFLWRYVDELIGKGLTLDVLAQFFWYMGLMLVPQALPLAILLSSLIAYGNLGESSELTAIKAAGISLMQSMRSLIVAVCLLACCSFYFQNVIGPEANKSFRQLLLSMKQFKQAIAACSSNAHQHLYVNRRTGIEVRSGVSRRLDQSMIAQFANQYKNPAMFRDLERPFHVNYEGESGIDAGGLAKDFASELVKDIGETRVGLFVLTPNGRNKLGSYKECLVPSPNETIRNPERMYYALGGLVAIGIRVALTQPYRFPPLFWDYLAGGSITKEHIFEIDEKYGQVIQSLEYALESGMTPEVFDNTFNLSSSVTDLRGREIPIGNSKKVTFTNCQRYIAQCHEYRIAELERPMRSIRDGFWDNLDLRIPQYVTAELLEFLACGDQAIDLSEMRARTKFVGVPPEIEKMFWKVIDRMTNEKRRQLLQFATGTMSIPHGTQIFLTVDFVKANEDERMPSSSTCFNRLHLPPFSSVEKMYKGLVTACEYTGTFEIN